MHTTDCVILVVWQCISASACFSLYFKETCYKQQPSFQFKQFINIPFLNIQQIQLAIKAIPAPWPDKNIVINNSFRVTEPYSGFTNSSKKKSQEQHKLSFNCEVLPKLE